MNTFADWAWYVGGGGVAVIALVLLYWSLLHDRPRGRRRCPKCWYDMSASPPPGTTCSECGYTAKRERKLLKTRRYWRRAMVSMLPLLLGIAMLLAPHVMRRGWTTYVPTAILVWLAPVLEDHPTSALATELADRINGRELRLWHWQTLMRQLERRDGWPVQVQMPKRWIVDVPFDVHVAPTNVAPYWMRMRDDLVCARIDPNGGAGSPLTVMRQEDWWYQPAGLEADPELERMREQMSASFRRNRFRGAPIYLLNDGRFVGEAQRAGTLDIVSHVELYNTLGRFWVSVPGRIEPDERIWSGEVRRTIRIVDDINDAMTPVADDSLVPVLIRGVQVVPVGGDMRVYRMGRTGTGSLAIGGVAELLRDGRVYGRSRIWVDQDGSVNTIDSGFGSVSTFVENEQWVRESKWTLRFRSGAEAIYDVDATHYWEGEFEVDLAPHRRWHHWLYPMMEDVPE